MQAVGRQAAVMQAAGRQAADMQAAGRQAAGWQACTDNLPLYFFNRPRIVGIQKDTKSSMQEQQYCYPLFPLPALLA
jgi:hypothetical protein